MELVDAADAIATYLASGRPYFVKPRTGSQLFLSERGTGLSRMMLWLIVQKYAKRAGITEDVDAPVKSDRNDRENLIAELRAERDANVKAAGQAAQEAEAEAWLAARRAAEAAEQKIDPESGFI